jgi:type IV pilus assembly protein PilN
MRISLNLATKPFADVGPALKQLRIAIAALAVVTIALGLGLRVFHVKAEEARNRDHSLDGSIARIQQERLGYQQRMRLPENAELLRHVAAINPLFDEKAFSWTLAMEDLETVLPAGVQATTLEPQREKDGHIVLRLRVVGPRDRAVELVRNLERSRHFAAPRITGENAESNGTGAEKLEPISASSKVNFDLLADYVPGGGPRPARKQSAEIATFTEVAPPPPPVPYQQQHPMVQAQPSNPTPPTASRTPRPPMQNQVRGLLPVFKLLPSPTQPMEQRTPPRRPQPDPGDRP